MFAPIGEVFVKKLLDNTISRVPLKFRIVEVIWDQHPDSATQAVWRTIHAAADAVYRIALVGRPPLRDEMVHHDIKDLLGGW